MLGCIYVQENDDNLNFGSHRIFYWIKSESTYADKTVIPTFSRTGFRGFQSHWI